MATEATLGGFRALIEAALRDVISPRKLPLYDMMSYHFGWGDARGQSQPPAEGEWSHGVACLVACWAAGGDPEVALPAAAAVELINGFCQVHDDVQGGNPGRHDRDAVWWVWGPAQAINAGDGMHALARLAIFRLREGGVSPEATFRAVQMLDQAGLELAEGRFQDLEAQERLDLDVEGYMKMAASKTGALYACAMRLGALVASAEEEVVDSLGTCGLKIGLARQVRDDLRELWRVGPEEVPPSPEVMNKKKLLPVVYAFQEASLKEKRRLGDIYFKRVLAPGDIPPLREILEELGARQNCEEMLAGYRSEAEEAVQGAGLLPEKAAGAWDLLSQLVGP